MPQVVAQADSWSRQYCSAALSWSVLTIWPTFVSSAKFLTVVTAATCASKLFMNTRKRTLPSKDPCGTPDNTLCHPDVLPIKNHSLFSLVQPVGCPSRQISTYSMCRKLFKQPFPQHLVKSLCKIQEYCIHCITFVHCTGDNLKKSSKFVVKDFLDIKLCWLTFFVDYCSVNESSHPWPVTQISCSTEMLVKQVGDFLARSFHLSWIWGWHWQCASPPVHSLFLVTFWIWQLVLELPVPATAAVTVSPGIEPGYIVLPSHK